MTRNFDQIPVNPGQPNFDNLLAVLRGDVPERPTLFEFFLNDRLHDRFTAGETIPAGPYAQQHKVILAFRNAGYDYANVIIHGFAFASERQAGTRTISINAGAVITGRATFEAYGWPDPDLAGYEMLDALAAILPAGMKLIVYTPDGVLENVIKLVGYENLCYLLADDRQLVAAVFDEVGARLLRYYERVVGHPAVGACIANDDWGYKTQTMLSPRDMRAFVFPWYKRIVDVVHAAGKPVILHSCGHFERIVDDIVAMGFDARHSYEDVILPVEAAYERYHDRFAILGGLDVDFVCRAAPEAVYERAKAMLERSATRGGYALGTGNSVPDYVPDAGYLAMIQAVLDSR